MTVDSKLLAQPHSEASREALLATGVVRGSRHAIPQSLRRATATTTSHRMDGPMTPR